ncbi:MAG: Wzz/FepE/Etk N-terminal domain-containing protein [Chloroflexi bacterium]|nr:Wzz/FepE/Etk N-terminal domain-containing protein [Chloroflexota bacterium]
MRLAQYGRILWRRSLILLLTVVITAAAAFLYSEQQTPVYLATQKIRMVPSRADNGLQLAATGLLNNHVEYLDSSMIAATVIERLELDMIPAFLKSRVTIAPDRLSLLIQIDVRLADGELANDVAWAYGQQLVEYRNRENQRARQEDRINAEEQDFPTYRQVSPNVRINTLAGAILGALLGGTLIFVLEYLASSVVSRREDLTSLGFSHLASIPAAHPGAGGT